MVEYRLHFCGAKAPLFLHEMQKTKENAIGTEAAQPPEYPADYFPLSAQSAAAFLPSLARIWPKSLAKAVNLWGAERSKIL